MYFTDCSVVRPFHSAGSSSDIKSISDCTSSEFVGCSGRLLISFDDFCNFEFAGMVHTVHTSSAFQMHMMHYASKATKCRRAGGPAKAADRPLQST